MLWKGGSKRDECDSSLKATLALCCLDELLFAKCWFCSFKVCLIKTVGQGQEIRTNILEIRLYYLAVTVLKSKLSITSAISCQPSSGPRNCPLQKQFLRGFGPKRCFCRRWYFVALPKIAETRSKPITARHTDPNSPEKMTTPGQKFITRPAFVRVEECGSKIQDLIGHYCPVASAQLNGPVLVLLLRERSSKTPHCFVS